MEEQQKSLVEFYVEALNTASTEEEVARIVNQAIRDPQLFVFSKLLKHPRTSKFESQLRHMAYGVLPSFETDEAVVSKLRKLTTLSYIRDNGWSSLELESLGSVLGLSGNFEVISFLLELRNLVDVVIDEREGIFHVTNVKVYRDVEDMETVQTQLANIIGRIEELVNQV